MMRLMVLRPSRSVPERFGVVSVSSALDVVDHLSPLTHILTSQELGFREVLNFMTQIVNSCFVYQ